jgi:uncharacterized protein YndB with AHSA1/START domain
MPHAERTITINRPPDQVFAFFADPANDRSWRAGVKEMSAEGAPRTGAHVHQVVSGPGGRSIPADIEIDAYEPPSRYAFHAIAGPVRPSGEFRFAPAASGTAVTFSLTADVGGWKKWVMGGQIQKTMDGEMAALDRAKAVLEGG